LPWDAYAGCGNSTPTILPDKVRIGLYEEFPVPWRLDKLRAVDFPVTLAVAATSRSEFLRLRDSISQTYPQVREIFFWPMLSADEGYYPGAWSDPNGVRRVAADADGLPVLWDMELPRDQPGTSLQNWWANRTFLVNWLRARKQPVHIWRTNRNMGLNPLFLRLAAMHFDPGDYPAVSLHLDMYHMGTDLPDAQFRQILRCGVEQYGNRFIPALGVLDDGEGAKDYFASPETLRHDLTLVRQTGVSEVWLFGVNGLNADYVAALHATLPLEDLASP